MVTSSLYKLQFKIINIFAVSEKTIPFLFMIVEKIR